MAALEVVYNNLKKAGLSDYCLQLHSYKANKRDFLDDLYNTINKPKILSDSYKINSNLKDLVKVKNRLNYYCEKLYRIYEPIGLSLYQLIGLSSTFTNIDPVPYIFRNISSISNETILNNCQFLTQYCNFKKTTPFNYKEFPLYGLIVHDSSFVFKLEIERLLKQQIGSCKKLLSVLEKTSRLFGVDVAYNTLPNFICFVQTALNNQMLNRDYYSSGVILDIISTLRSLQENDSEIRKLKAYLDTKFVSEIYTKDGQSIYESYKNEGATWFKRLFNKKYRDISHEILRLRINGKRISRKEILTDLDSLVRYQNLVNLFEEQEKTIVKFSFIQYQGRDTDWASFISQLYDFQKQLLDHPEFGNAVFDDDCLEEYISDSNRSIDDFKNSVGQISPYIDGNVVCFEHPNIELIDTLNNYLSNLDKMDIWIQYNNLHASIKSVGLIDYVNAFISNNRPLCELVDAYKVTCYKQWIDYIIQNDSTLNLYNRFSHESDIRVFSGLDQKQIDYSKAIINSKLSELRPDPRMIMTGSPIAVLLREHEKKRKLKPIRTLIQEMPGFIQKIKPCFLMSPLSISTFLDEKIQFDVTIFDEASQVFPEDAVVAIYRSKQLIVVGDSKQMPPSKFFMATDMDDDEYDENESDIDSYESILDLCATAFPTKSLLCHYRSRDESLIAFSNKSFYKNNLLTYPSVHERKEDLGVDFTFVSDGIMDSKTKTNLKEAEMVVEMVFEHFKKHPDRSLGVVAFNIRQQDMILKMLDRKRSLDPSLEEYFRPDKNEPFFVKNLETVQGDERDTIIFSVTYAKNQNGQFALRFGPLNMVGGERRLNVAITRAKLNVKVVSSIRAIDIDTTRVANDGPKLLHDYLDYAEHGPEVFKKVLSSDDDLKAESPFEIDVYNFLKSLGFEVVTQLGCSNYRIDLALKRPGTSDYVLAIECDGERYHSSKSVRDRDRLRQSVLERMDWQFYRIWSVDWYKNNRAEKEALLEACRLALTTPSSDLGGTNTNNDETNDNTDSVMIEVSTDKLASLYPPYHQTQILSSKHYSWVSMCEYIVENEAPISVEYVLKRVSYAFGWQKITPSIRRQLTSPRFLHQIKLLNGYFYTNDSEYFEMRRDVDKYFNNIDCLSDYEIRNGMYMAVEHFEECTKENLFEFIRKSLGFARTGDKIFQKFNRAFKLLEPYIVIGSGGKIRISKKNILNLIKRS